jgi:nicotinate-nucleotide--dimethylbenzimidazole phosphoribosyltransferase
MEFAEIVHKIKSPDKNLEQEAQKKMDAKTKPLGSLGSLERVAVKMAVIQHDLNPTIRKKGMFVFAGDHGITAEMVSAYPAAVTAQMVLNFINGGAAINALCRHNEIELAVVDMGVNFDFNQNPGIIDKKVAYGTRNFAHEPAMSREQARQALQNGADVFSQMYATRKFDIAGVGDMGIGNTASASAIIAAATGEDPGHTTGRGTGIGDEALSRKIEIIRAALRLHKIDRRDPLDILCKVGGFEIAGISGAVLASAAQGIPIVIDGVIAAAGALIASLFSPLVKEYVFAGHKSAEKGHLVALSFMGLEPLLDLQMRLGEGTGAALAIHLIDSACRIMREMASFSDAGVETAL